VHRQSRCGNSFSRATPSRSPGSRHRWRHGRLWCCASSVAAQSTRLPPDARGFGWRFFGWNLGPDLFSCLLVALRCRAVLGISWVPFAAFLGALLSMIFIYRFSLFRGRLHPYHLLLSGVIFNSLVAAVIMFLNSILDFYQAQGLLFWLMGSLSTRTYLTVAFIWA